MRARRPGLAGLMAVLLAAPLLGGPAGCKRRAKLARPDAGALDSEAQAAATAPEPPPPLPDFRSRKLTAPLQIDGALGDWARIPATRVADGPNVVMQARPWKGPRDLSFRARFAHDDQALYVAVEVDDDVVVAPAPPDAGPGGAPPRPRSLSRLDHVEVWLAHPEIKEPAMADRYLLRVALGPRGEVQVLAPGEGAGRARSIEAAGRVLPGGYVVEARLPLEVLQPLPQPELSRLAVLVDVIDADETARPARDRMMSSSTARKPDDLTTFGKLTFEPPLLKAGPLARWSQHPSQHLAGGWRRGRDGTWFFACHHPDHAAANSAASAAGAGAGAGEAEAGGARGRKHARGRGRGRGRERGRARPRRPGGVTWSAPKVRDTALVRLGAQRVRLQLLVSPCDGSAVLAAYREGEETSFSALKLPGQPVAESGEARRAGPLLRAFQLPGETPAVALRLLKQDTSAAGGVTPAAAVDGGTASPGGERNERTALNGVVYALHDDGLSAVWEHELARHEPGQPGFRCDFKIAHDRQTIDYRCSEGKDPALEASAGVYRWDGAQYVFDRATGGSGSGGAGSGAGTAAGSSPGSSAPTPPARSPGAASPASRAVPGATGLPHVEPGVPPAPPPAPPATVAPAPPADAPRAPPAPPAGAPAGHTPDPSEDP